MGTLTMSQYLTEIEYSATKIIEIIWKDHQEAHRLAHHVANLATATQAGYNRAEAIALDAEDPDDVAMAAGAHWDTYFGADKEHHYAAADLQELRARLSTRQFSAAAAAGAILQHAKQGISIVHGGPGPCPEGRLVTATQSLKNVIWQSRNQAIHWEEGRLNDAVLRCFTALASERHQRFADVYGGSRAFDVLQLLGWRSWESFRADLETLA